MPKRMLIDASHPEETRVVVLAGQKVEEFDFESASKRPLKGNIYLAKVTRVEPSLQAAFVEYGGNRQGFLAFSEIHPDYYQIPVADRLALLAEQEAAARRQSEDEFEAVETANAPAKGSAVNPDDDTSDDDDETHSDDDDSEDNSENHENGDDHNGDHDDGNGDWNDNADEDSDADADTQDHTALASPDDADHDGDSEDSDDDDASGAIEAQENTDQLESAGDANEDASTNGETQSESDTDKPQSKPAQARRPSQRWTKRKHYKIQEVIKRRQIILVQVVKEERGNKGAALTTYLSLAGRYCVLMPNTPRGGGISRKITNANDRKRLKSAASSLELPEGMGLIIRTAGENRTKVEIKRDYEYLLRMWDTIRELTLKSNAPACVYEEGDLIKRAIRDLYNKDVTEVIVEGDDGYRNAKDFMRMLMPSHAKNVKQSKETVPLFQRFHIEAQLDAMFSQTVTLKSGGYIVINQTEALVAVDVNSGRATREHSIEETALKTNLEAADEMGRQLRLRDLAGLIVIDFIDMEDGRNDRAVEKRLRDAVKNDRARIQIGKISQFGLLEMSRQRLRAGVIAGSTIACPHCEGQGIIRSVESTALRVLRGLEEEGQKQRAAAVTVYVPEDVAIYTLNQKRRELARIEADYGMHVQFEPKTEVLPGHFEIERTAQMAPENRVEIPVSIEAGFVTEAEDDDADETPADDNGEDTHNDSNAARDENAADGEGDNGGRKRRRRRRGRRKNGNESAKDGSDNQNTDQAASETHDHADDKGSEAQDGDTAENDANGNSTDNGEVSADGTRRRRRRRRGGRGRGRRAQEGSQTSGEEETAKSEPGNDTSQGSAIPNAPSAPVWSLTPEPEAKPEPVHAQAEPDPVHEDPATSAPAPQKPSSTFAEETMTNADKAGDDEPVRRGWWQRTFR